LEQKEKVNELRPKLEAPYKFTNVLEAINKLRAEPKANEPKANDKYLSSFVIVDESVGNTSNNLTAGFNNFFCGNKKLCSYVVLENSGYDLIKDTKWNVVKLVKIIGYIGITLIPICEHKIYFILLLLFK